MRGKLNSGRVLEGAMTFNELETLNSLSNVQLASPGFLKIKISAMWSSGLVLNVRVPLAPPLAPPLHDSLPILAMFHSRLWKSFFLILLSTQTYKNYSTS